MDVATALSLLSTLLVGLVLGALASRAVARLQARAREAGLVAERDLLLARVTTLESSAAHDRSLAEVLVPLRQGLERVERQVGQLERDRVEQFSRIDHQLSAVASSGEALRQQTASLAGALRSSNVRGTWGEAQLKRVVEAAGMLARVDFTEQPSATGPDGRVVRPDLVVNLPGGKHLVVDAKAPLTAFLDAGGADSPERERLLLAHAKALRGHVDVLAGRAYWAAFTPTPEMVVCFVPGDAILAAALDADPSLYEHAMAARVVLACPATLLAVLHLRLRLAAGRARRQCPRAVRGGARAVRTVGDARLAHRQARPHPAALGRGLQRDGGHSRAAGAGDGPQDE